MKKFLSSLLVLGFLLPTSVAQAGYSAGSVQFDSVGGITEPVNQFTAGTITLSAAEHDLAVKSFVVRVSGSVNPNYISSLSLVQQDDGSALYANYYSQAKKGFIFTFDDLILSKGTSKKMTLMASFSQIQSLPTTVQFVLRTTADFDVVDMTTGEKANMYMSLCGGTYCTGKKITVIGGALNVLTAPFNQTSLFSGGEQNVLHFYVNASDFENIELKKVKFVFKTNLPANAVGVVKIQKNGETLASFAMPSFKNGEASLETTFAEILMIPAGNTALFQVVLDLNPPVTTSSQYFTTIVRSVTGKGGKTASIITASPKTSVSNTLDNSL